MALSFGTNQKASLEAYQVQLQKPANLFTAFDAVTKQYTDDKILAAKNEILGGASQAYDTLKEIETYLNSNSSMSSALLSSVQSNATALASEVSRATNSEALLSSRISDEVSARQTSDALINSSVLSEVIIRRDDDIALGLRIDNEFTRATLVEQKVATDLSTEKKTRETADNFIKSEVYRVEGERVTADDALNARADALTTRVDGLDSSKLSLSGGTVYGTVNMTGNANLSAVSVSGNLNLNLSESSNTYLFLSPVWRIVCSNTGDRVQFEFFSSTLNAWTVALPFIMPSV